MSKYSRAVYKRVQQLRPIDDAMFRVIAAEKKICEEMLRTILDEPELVVLDVTTQKAITSFTRELIMDVYCMLGDGTLCNIEVQKGTKNDDIKRTRFHASAITTHYTRRGSEFKEIPSVTVIYITEYDALNNHQTFTEVRRCQKLNETWIPVEDDERLYFVNTVVDDGSDRAKLMSLLVRDDVFEDTKFINLSMAMKYLKQNAKGVTKMCEVVEEYAQERVTEVLLQSAKELLVNGIDAELISKSLHMPLEQVKELQREMELAE